MFVTLMLLFRPFLCHRLMWSFILPPSGCLDEKWQVYKTEYAVWIDSVCVCCVCVCVCVLCVCVCVRALQMERKKIEAVNIGGTHNIIDGTCITGRK